MSTLPQQQHSDSADSALDGPSPERFTSRQDAFLSGIKHAAGAPAIVLFAGMVGFGAMGKTNGFDLWFPALTSLLMFALPGQVVLMEMVMTGSSVIAIALAVTLTSTRFVTMTVTLFPQLHQKDRNRNLYASVHLLAMTVWSMTMREFPSIERKHRLNYFIGFGLVCWLMSIPGTILGYYLAAWVPAAVTLGLIFINPLFFLLTFTDVKPWVNRIAIALGCILGPLFYFIDRDSSLLAAGVIAGTLAYYIDRKMIRKRPGVIG